MSPSLTLILLAASSAVAVFSGWRGARPPDLAKGPRMAPWRFIMLAAAALAVLLLIHLASVLGGRTFPTAY
ncbi:MULTISPECIES: hypothetical protein [unclassified Brevundimonas]|uniref:hypothetical protein n=1 Tax=unclassified Brevundimonas TaxID=2622653 RepID=UPI003F91DA68